MPEIIFIDEDTLTPQEWENLESEVEPDDEG